MDKNHVLTGTDLERLIKLEVETRLGFENMDKALILARDMSKDERIYFREHLDSKLLDLNGLQRKMAVMEGTFVTGKDLELLEGRMDQKISPLTKFVYVGLGAVAALELILKFFVK